MTLEKQGNWELGIGNRESGIGKDIVSLNSIGGAKRSSGALKEYLTQENCQDWLCPDLREYWNLGRVRNSNKIILRAIAGQEKFLFSPTEGYTLRYFTGQYTVKQIQKLAQQEFPDADPNLVVNLLQKLISHQILALDEPEDEETRGRGDAGDAGN